MPYPEILHHGAALGVTGPCHQLQMDVQHSLLIDCGLFQGAETPADCRGGAASLVIDFPRDTVKALVAIHVHIDHVGRISYLMAARFKGPILCCEPSARLLPIDTFKQGTSDDQRRYFKLIGQRLIALPYKHWFTLADTPALLCRVRLPRAGYILGSAYVKVDPAYGATGRTRRDLGAPHVSLLPTPQSPSRADTLVIESIYGDRLYEDRCSRRQRLEAVIEQAQSNQGGVLIPASSVSCIQELLYELEDIAAFLGPRSHPAGKIRPPTARLRATDHGCSPCRPPAPRRAPGEHVALGHRHRRQRHVHRRAHRQLPEGHAGKIIGTMYSSSAARPWVRPGMLSRSMGRGVLTWIWRASVVRSGLPLHPEGYSVHADWQGLVSFITRMREWLDEIRLAHGEAEAKRVLAAEMQSKYEQRQKRMNIIIP